MTRKPKVIIVTDGDSVARKAVEEGAKNIGARCISASAGNPTLLEGEKIVELVHKTPSDPVVVMVDDKGDREKGKGETALEYMLKDKSIEVMGVVAVASNTEGVDGIQVDLSVTKDGKIQYNKAVDKDGKPKPQKILYGDTVDVLRDYELPIIVGIGDPGKMDGKDDCCYGAPIITKALEQILNNGN